MATSALRWFKAAIILQALLLAYYLSIEVVNLFPWNDLAARSADFDLARSISLNALPQLAFIALFALGIRVAAMLSVFGYAAYLCVQLWAWWKPVILPEGADAPQQYAALYVHTLKVVPTDWIRLAPDAQHLTLQALTLVTVFTMVMAIGRMRYL